MIRLLAPYDLDIVVSDPYLDDAAAAALGVERVSLDELVASSDVVSLHAPSLPSTENLIHAGLVAKLRNGATFIHTSRGELVDQDALLSRRRLGGCAGPASQLGSNVSWGQPASARRRAGHGRAVGKECRHGYIQDRLFRG